MPQRGSGLYCTFFIVARGFAVAMMKKLGLGNFHRSGASMVEEEEEGRDGEIAERGE